MREELRQQAVRRIARLILAQRYATNDADRIVTEPLDLKLAIEFVPPDQLIEALNEAVRTITALDPGGQQWALSPCDIALTGPVTHSGTTMMLLHPADATIDGLAEVPEHMRIIGVVHIPPYRLFRRPAEPPQAIAEHRQKAISYAAHQQALSDVEGLYHRLLSLYRTASLSPPSDRETYALARQEYEQAMRFGPEEGMVHILRAVSLLGLFPSLFGSVLVD